MKRWKKVTIICICVIVGILFVFRYVADLGMWSGTSFDTYKEKAYRGQFCDELPNDSKDFRFYCFNSGFGAYSMAAFTLDGKDYDDSIDNYRIIYYDSYKGAGTKIFAIVTNPNTGRIIIYAGGSN